MEGGPPTFRQDFTCPALLEDQRRSLPVRGCHPLWPAFPDGSGCPDRDHWPGPRSLATTCGVSVDVLSSGYLDVSVPRVRLAAPMNSVRRYRRSGGLPHSEIHGSKPARGSPWLIATCCVLHRLSVPRHPPDALQTLDLIGAYSKVNRHYECATRRRKPTRNSTTSPQTHPAKMHHHDPTDCLPLLRRRPCRVILGHLFSSHVKDPIPALERISAFSLIGYRR